MLYPAELDTTEQTRMHPQRTINHPITKGPPHTLIGRARHAPRRAPLSRRDRESRMSRCTSQTLPLRTPAPRIIGLYTHCRPGVLHMPSCEAFLYFFLICRRIKIMHRMMFHAREKDATTHYMLVYRLSVSLEGPNTEVSKFNG